MTCLLVVGLWCTNPNERERPKAAQVIKVLQLESPLPVLPQDMHDHPFQPTMVTFRNCFQSSNRLVNDGCSIYNEKITPKELSEEDYDAYKFFQGKTQAALSSLIFNTKVDTEENKVLFKRAFLLYI
ncbi:Dual specificity testis-specific protein kinase 2 [Stylosanthes scabra]|uniref:Dual specificity testis-specific protein kinase 2 n=1 Tax=Stylosanthes scabra TaxID=79078 RepID=A0ABU6VQ63_9FABA|nr:Dual specificity testis-specific protein kinase 2 [Stylosanthes scabra]